MRKAQRLRCLTWFITLSLFVSLISGTFSVKRVEARSPVGKPKDDKVSADLRERARNAHSNERVSVIVQPKGEWGSQHDDEVLSRGGRVKRRFGNFSMRVIELPAHAVEMLAARDDIEYVSPDREIKSTGHLFTTSGAWGLMATSGKGGLDGTNIGLAIFDSGVESTHLSFNANRVAHVVKSVDFTGEGITTDKYGHGTHVASMAMGGGNVTQVVNGVPQSYQGMAFNAPTVSLRVLNSQGRGTVSGLLSAVDWVIANRTTYKSASPT